MTYGTGGTNYERISAEYPPETIVGALYAIVTVSSDAWKVAITADESPELRIVNDVPPATNDFNVAPTILLIPKVVVMLPTANKYIV